MATTGGIELSTDDLREVAGYAARCAEQALEIVEAVRPDDSRPREAVEAAGAFARGGARGKALRDTAWPAAPPPWPPPRPHEPRWRRRAPRTCTRSPTPTR